MTVLNANPDLRVANTVKVAKSLIGQGQYTTIQAAINYAATQSPSATNPWLVLVYSGVYTEAITGSAYVYVKGAGPTEDVVIQQVDGTILTLASNFTIESVTIRLVTPTLARNLIVDGGAALSAAELNHIDIQITTPGALAHNCILLSGASGLLMDKVNCDLAGTGASNILSVTGAASVLIDRGVLNQDSTSATSTVINVSNTGATVEITGGHAEAMAGISIACSAGIVILHKTHYHSLSRTGTGNIVDHTSGSQDELWHVFSLMFEIADASANIGRRTASGGTINDGGTGQVQLHVSTSNGSTAGIENAADFAGSSVTTFNPARSVKNSIQITVDTFIANNTQFHGLRATLAATIPAVAEIHAGFKWTGTQFLCSSSDGAGVGQTTLIATPSTGVQHQYQVICFGGKRVEFYVDGALVATHANAAGLPSGEMQWCKLNNNTGITASVVNVGVRRLYCQECPA